MSAITKPWRRKYEPTTTERIKGADRRIARFRVLPLDQLRGLPEAAVCESGVYFLWNGPELIYIGQSESVATRVGQHRYFGKRFTRATFEAHCKLRSSFEGEYIRRYEPPLNVMGTWRR